jgi:hypothetical protein
MIHLKETYIRLRADDTLFSNENSTQITNVVYEPITTAQLGALEPENIPKQIVTSLRNAIKRHHTIILVSSHCT